MSGLDDGWDDDLDVEIDDVEDETEATMASSIIPGTNINEPIVKSAANDSNNVAVTDGWDNDVLFEEDDANDDVNNDEGLPDAAPTVQAFTTAPQIPQDTPVAADGRDDDDIAVDNDDNDDDDELNFDDDGWGDNNDNDDANLSFNDTAEESSSSYQRLVQELENYVSSLDRMVTSINAILEYEYNVPLKAQDLVDYYINRPQLAEYTRSKELQRMNYQVVLPHGEVETDKDEILANNLLRDDSLVSCAANQSLLADLLQVITGNDLIVRPQYLAVCIADFCQFTIHLGDQGQDMVECKARLHLSFPTEHGDRLDVAQILVLVVFAPNQPMVEYKIHKIDVLLQDYSQLASTAEFLHKMEGHFDEIPGHYENANIQNASSEVFRDAFLENSQRLLSQSTEGMKSALQQVDSVINIKGKIQTISNFIPGTDQMLAAEQEAMEFALAEARKREMEERQQANSNSPYAFPRPTPPHPPRVPGPAVESQGYNQQVDDTNRPKSILGGFVRRLAKSVTIPDDDPAIYGPHTPRSTASSTAQSVFYRKEDLTPSDQGQGLKLYRRDESPQKNSNKVLHPLASPPPQANSPSNQRQLQTEHNFNIFSLGNQPQRSRGSVQRALASQLDGQTSDSIQHDKSTAPIGLHRVDGIEHSQEANKIISIAEDIQDDMEVLDNGWDDDDLDEIAGDDDAYQCSINQTDHERAHSAREETTTVILPDVAFAEGLTASQETSLALEMTYNSDDDIIETRKRWVNPRPYRPYIKS